MITAGGSEKLIPEWWIKELARVDPTYYVVYARAYDYFTVMKKVKYLYEDKGKMERVEREVPLAVFRNLNDAALNELRARKEVGRRFDYEKNPTGYLDWIKQLRRDTRAKQHELAIELQAEGLMKIHQAKTNTGFFSAV